jgi:chromosome segregation ATPase
LKALPILNAAGCLFLAGFIVVQWNSAQKLDKELRASRLNERNVRNEKVEIEKQVVQLQTDIDNFKASIELMKAEEEALKKKVADGELLVNQQHTGLSFNYAYFTAMDQAITQQNARITELNSSLSATRRRLDDAITELKKAGAR